MTEAVTPISCSYDSGVKGRSHYLACHVKLSTLSRVHIGVDNKTNGFIVNSMTLNDRVKADDYWSVSIVPL